MKQKMIFYGLLIFLITSFSACEKNEEIDLNTTQNKSLDLNEFVPELPLFVTEAQAKEVGINFLNMMKGEEIVGQYSEIDIEEFLTIKNDVNQPILYIMNLEDNKGFTVLSASTVEKPILAYSYEGVFDVENIESYDGVNDWAAMKFVKVNYLVNHSKEVDSEVAHQWVVLKPNLDIQIANDPNIFSILEIFHQSFGPLTSAEWNQVLLDSVNGYTTSGIDINTIINEVQASRVVYLNGCAEMKLTSGSIGAGSFNWSISSMSESYINCHDFIVERTRRMRIKYRVRRGFIQVTFPDYLHINWKLGGNNNGWYDYENWSDVEHVNYNSNYLYSQYMTYNLNTAN